MKLNRLLVIGGIGLLLSDVVIGLMAFNELWSQGRPWVYGWACVGLLGAIGIVSIALGASDSSQSRDSEFSSRK